jgi:hypothetical protein
MNLNVFTQQDATRIAEALRATDKQQSRLRNRAKILRARPRRLQRTAYMREFSSTFRRLSLASTSWQ